MNRTTKEESDIGVNKMHYNKNVYFYRNLVSFATCYKWEFSIHVTDARPAAGRQELGPS